MDLPTFRTVYREFDGAPDDLVGAFLSAAATELDPGVWGVSGDGSTPYDIAHGLITADKLALAPNGQMARLQSATGKTTYREQFDRRARWRTMGLRNT